MVHCNNCNNSNAQYHLCSNCYNNIFKSLYCDGHCGRKCDPSQRTGSNIIALPWWWYCETCRKKRENPNLPPNVKREMTEDEIDRLLNENKQLKEENEQWKKKNEDLEKAKENLEKVKGELENKNEVLETIQEAFKGTYHEDRKNLEKFYDIIVDIDSLRHMFKGWKVKFTEQGKENYDIMKEKKVLVVGVVGNRNRGKSFVLSKLSKVNLPDGTSIKTEGISLKYPEMQKDKPADYILMDSAGFENALLETDEFTNDPLIKREDALRRLELIASDKTLTEYFIQNFIIQKSNILIVVIGILNYPEQKLLNRIKTENKNKNKNLNPPPLFVIHNLQTFSLKKQVEDYIEETLLKSATFKLTELKDVGRTKEDNKNQNQIYFIEEFNNEEDKGTVIYHLILAMHGTEAGNYYNDFVYEFLSKQFNAFPLRTKFPIIEDVKQQCMENSTKTMVNPIESLNEFEESETEIKLKSVSEEEDKKKLNFKRCLVDELGFSSFYGANFDPKYAYYKTLIEKKPYLCIQVEVPGEAKISCKAKIVDKNLNITVKGNKYLTLEDKKRNEKKSEKKSEKKTEKEEENDDIIEEKDKDLSFNKREEGEFKLIIKLNPEYYDLKDNNPNKNLTKRTKGLYRFYFPLKDDEGSINEDDEDDE